MTATRFDGLAQHYTRYRPDYPAAAMAAIAEACGTSSPAGGQLVDVGAGTGIASRQLADALGPEWRITGVEPGADMRRMAESLSADYGNLHFITAPAEALPFAAGSAQGVLTAQALHWFDRPAFYLEAGRILVPGGLLMVLFNDRVLEAPVFQELEALLEREMADYSRHYRSFDYAGELAELSWATALPSERFPWSWRLAPDDFAGLMLSRSLARPWRERVGEAQASATLAELAAAYLEPDGLVELPYVSKLAWSKKL